MRIVPAKVLLNRLPARLRSIAVVAVEALQIPRPKRLVILSMLAEEAMVAGACALMAKLTTVTVTDVAPMTEWLAIGRPPVEMAITRLILIATVPVLVRKLTVLASQLEPVMMAAPVVAALPIDVVPFAAAAALLITQARPIGTVLVKAVRFLKLAFAMAVV